MSYSNILVGLDLSDESDTVLQRALALVETHKAKLHLVHILEPLTFAYGGDIPMDLSEVQQQLQDRAAEQMTGLLKRFSLSDVSTTVLVGNPATELHRLADEYHCDLIVVGSHGRHGLSLLLGSTASSVLHGAKCDILAIRV